MKILRTVHAQFERSTSIRNKFHTPLMIALFFIFISTPLLAQPAANPSASLSQITWNDRRYFPHFANPDSVFVFPVTTPVGSGSGAWQSNWRVYDEPQVMHGLTLAAMQGIINREQPSVFLNWKDPFGHFPDYINDTWANEINNHVQAVYINDLTSAGTIQFLWNKYSDLFSGAVIYDPDIVDTINLATMIAGLENRVMLAPQQIGMDGIPDFQDIYDLRTLAQNENWDETFESQVKIYQWVYDNLWPQLEHRIIATESPGPPLSGDPDTQDLFPVGIAARDYLVALKLPILYLNPKIPDHEELLIKFFEEAESPIPVTGVVAFNEGGMVDLASGFGNFKAALNWPGEPITGGNYTVLSGIRPAIVKATNQINENNILGTLSDNPVATIFISDGDALFFQSSLGFISWFQWPNVLDQKIGWETNPILSELAPVVWNHYQETNNHASFLAGISGGGDVNLFEMSDVQRTNYLQRTKTYFEDTGLRVARINAEKGNWDESLAADYYDNLSPAGYLGTIISFNGYSESGTSLRYYGRPAPAMKPSYWLTPANMDEAITGLINKDINNEIIEVKTENHIPEIENVDDPDATDGKAMLIHQSYFNSESYSLAFVAGPMSLFPGEYEVSVRLKVDSNSSANPIAVLSSGKDFSTNPVYFGSTQISAFDFNSNGEYQEFTFEMNLSEITDNIEVRLDYGDGSTDLYVDNIVVTNTTPVNLPVYAPLYMSLAVDPSLHGGMESLTADFEAAFASQGGLLLTPDEFMASLNPEFMISFSENYLSSSDPGLIQAKQEFGDQKFFQSLLTIRAALAGVAISNNPDDLTLPKDFNLSQNYPNPFNPTTTIDFTLPEPAEVTLEVFDMLGRTVATLINRQTKQTGRYSIRFDAGQLASGVYLYRLRAGNTSIIRKLTLIK